VLFDGIRRRDVRDYYWKGWKDKEGGDCGDKSPKLHAIITHCGHFVRHIFVALLQGIVSILELLVVGYHPSLYSSII
jgi:hypothetical protein